MVLENDVVETLSVGELVGSVCFCFGGGAGVGGCV